MLITLISFFRYFTMWILLLDVLYIVGIIRGIELTLIYYHLIVIIGSIIFVHIEPKMIDIKYLVIEKERVKEIEMRLEGGKLKVIDIIYHYIPFIIILYLVYKSKNRDLINTNNNILNVLIPLSYYLLFDINKIYKINKNTIAIISIILLVIYNIIIRII